MNTIGRFILRFLLVPLGAMVAISVGAAVLAIANWQAYVALANADPDLQENYFLALFFAGPALLALLSYSAVWMVMLAAIGVLIAETFAFRSWIYHAANGGLSAWIGWWLVRNMGNEARFLGNPTIIVAAGLAAGFAYWLIAGWSAGFWKPVFHSPPVSADGVAQV